MPHEAICKKAEDALWSPGPSGLAYLHRRGLTDRVIREARLGYDPGDHSITIPYLNPDGSVRFLRRRLIEPNGKLKYLQPKRTGMHLYNVGATAKPRVWLTEGEFDSLILRQMGFPACGVPGSNGFKGSWKYLFIYTDEVTIVADADDAGQHMSHRLSSILGSVTDVRQATLPFGKDVNELYIEDKVALRRAVA